MTGKFRYKINKQTHAGLRIIGKSPEVILRRVGLSARFLDDPDAVVTPSQYFAIWTAAEAFLGCRTTATDYPEILFRPVDIDLPLSPGTIRYFKADLLGEGSFAEAMKGCGVSHRLALYYIEHR